MFVITVFSFQFIVITWCSLSWHAAQIMFDYLDYLLQPLAIQTGYFQKSFLFLVSKKCVFCQRLSLFFRLTANFHSISSMFETTQSQTKPLKFCKDFHRLITIARRTPQTPHFSFVFLSRTYYLITLVMLANSVKKLHFNTWYE